VLGRVAHVLEAGQRGGKVIACRRERQSARRAAPGIRCQVRSFVTPIVWPTPSGS
jgi:hypothetical protein